MLEPLVLGPAALVSRVLMQFSHAEVLAVNKLVEADFEMPGDGGGLAMSFTASPIGIVTMTCTASGKTGPRTILSGLSWSAVIGKS